MHMTFWILWYMYVPISQIHHLQNVIKWREKGRFLFHKIHDNKTPTHDEFISRAAVHMPYCTVRPIWNIIYVVQTPPSPLDS